MAVKKSKPATTTTPKKAAMKTAAPKAAADTAVKAGTPKAAPKAAVKAKVKVKKPAPVKLTDKQLEFLKTVSAAGDAGFKEDKKSATGLAALLGKKLIKKGAKDKATGFYSYTVSSAGKKHLSTASAPTP
jgi:hypothetical protein